MIVKIVASSIIIIKKDISNIDKTIFEDKDFRLCWSSINIRPLIVIENRSRPKDGSDISEELKQKILSQIL